MTSQKIQPVPYPLLNKDPETLTEPERIIRHEQNVMNWLRTNTSLFQLSQPDLYDEYYKTTYSNKYQLTKRQFGSFMIRQGFKRTSFTPHGDRTKVMKRWVRMGKDELIWKSRPVLPPTQRSCPRCHGEGVITIKRIRPTDGIK